MKLFGTISVPGKPGAGATLVEVMLAMVILLVMALAGATSLYQARATLNVQRNKRLALEAANSRLEQIRGTNYWSITTNIAFNYTVNYLIWSGGRWQLGSNETVLISGRPMPIMTTVQYQDLDGGATSYDCLKVTAAVGYRLSPLERVTVQTLWAP